MQNRTSIANLNTDFSVYSSSYGALLPNRHGSINEGYRYGFQGQEQDDEVKGEGNSVNYKYRMHDPRVGRFFAVDPLTKQYPHYSPYSFSGNKVIAWRELEGLEEINAIEFGDYYIMFWDATARARGQAGMIIFKTDAGIVIEQMRLLSPNEKQIQFIKERIVYPVKIKTNDDGGYSVFGGDAVEYKPGGNKANGGKPETVLNRVPEGLECKGAFGFSDPPVPARLMPSKPVDVDFDPWESTIKNKRKTLADLKPYADFAISDPTVTIELQGTTVGNSTTFNKSKSKNATGVANDRAKEVKKELIKQGVPSSQIKILKPKQTTTNSVEIKLN